MYLTFTEAEFKKLKKARKIKDPIRNWEQFVIRECSRGISARK
jgi:hypothetical protein